ncbi:hypothetical protein PTTG_01180 [Puccinia triticina 1-1 BBBD Race 1]|uniref:Uncharacterized protein n=1 Tax=Puccinia triticina (isolate 1-1 / race 1 (BBBD)) TaxID=630390 RepID=A0A0C4EKA5_PUCT1|nr:hypothetical protein PTTG_01180 [Puccinia triticina 1-1 BBBD Race 1]
MLKNWDKNQRSKNNLETLTQWRLFQLADIDFQGSHSQFKEWYIANEKDVSLHKQISEVPLEIFAVIFDKHLQRVGHSTLNEVKKLITDLKFLWNPTFQNFIPNSKPIREHIRDYFFMIVDFLFESEFINKEIIRSLFLEEKVVFELVHHTINCFKKETKITNLDWGPKLTENWYWKHVQNFHAGISSFKYSHSCLI